MSIQKYVPKEVVEILQNYELTEKPNIVLLSSLVEGTNRITFTRNNFMENKIKPENKSFEQRTNNESNIRLLFNDKFSSRLVNSIFE